MKPLFYILPVFLIVLGGNCARKSSISIVCPDPQIVEVTEFPVAISDLQLQGPELGGECLDGGFSYFIPEYEQITEGKNTLTYVGQNDCGDEASCLFVAHVLNKENSVIDSNTYDYRLRFVGTYFGFQDCYAINKMQTQADQYIELKVKLAPAPDQMLVDDEIVTVDSNGVFPYETHWGYRRYNLSFRHDSLFLKRQWGNFDVNETCNFWGKKK